MDTIDQQKQTSFVLGQKYAYATVSLVLGIFCFINLAGMEKASLAVIFAWLALKSTPPPALNQRRLWAKVGLVLGSIILILVPILIVLYLNRLSEFIEVLSKMSAGR
jgi:hypothetical protein